MQQRVLSASCLRHWIRSSGSSLSGSSISNKNTDNWASISICLIMISFNMSVSPSALILVSSLLLDRSNFERHSTSGIGDGVLASGWLPGDWVFSPPVPPPYNPLAVATRPRATHNAHTMGSSILITDMPQELLQKIALYATLGSPLGPPKELYNLLLTCRLFRDTLSPKNASELYAFIFAQKFDARAPSLRLGAASVREQAPFEMRRRFEFIRIFRQRNIHHPDLTQALWTAYTMVEDSDTSQKNMKQLLRAGMVDFLDLYLRERLYEGAKESNDGWPVLNEQNSLAIALSWTLSSQSSVNREDRTTSDSMRDLLRPIVFAAFRYSIFPTTEDAFGFGGSFEPAQVPTVMKPAATVSVASPISGSSQIDPSSIAAIAQNQKPFPLSVLAPCEVAYFGEITLKARLPPAALFASLLYFTRMESITPFSVPPHISYATRAEAQARGYNGVCLEDYEHFYRNCRTKFADFPALDVGVQSTAMGKEEGTIFQPVPYQLGSLSGRWQGSQLMPFVQEYKSWTESPSLPKEFDAECRSPLYLSIEEHYCYDIKAAVPRDDLANGMKNAWLPRNLQATATRDGRVEFSDVEGTFHTTYKTYRRGNTPTSGRGPQRQVVDVIITGKTDDQYARWGGGTVILGRVRMQDGLMVLVKSLPDNPDEGATRTLLRGYVTSSQNLVGRVKGSWTSSESYYEGVFSLGKDHNTSRPYH
ncbi:unnamed protein product [Cyclocybe aegerita]|uniref:F-box domain-containing protein n=1 Tax=Cyclocybe aegerita TaxID=1973307 RepID=A0A8S0WPB2_CYCAE|nr:unnamed protein product [Cyclocybe aegerita]